MRFPDAMRRGRKNGFSRGRAVCCWASRFRPIVADPAGETFFAHLTGRKRYHHCRGMRLIGSKSHAVVAQEDHHAHECNALIAIDESMVLRQTKSICRGKLGKL